MILEQVRRHLIACIGAVILLLLLGLYALQVVERNRVADLMEQRKHDKETLVDELIFQKGERLRTLACDYSWWNDMVEFVNRPDSGWANENLEPGLSTFGADIAWVFDAKGRWVFCSTHPVHEVLTRDTSQATDLSASALREAFGHFFVWSSQGVIEICTAPVQPSSDSARTSAPHGFLVVGQLWTSEYIDEMARAAGVALTLQPLSSPSDTTIVNLNKAPSEASYFAHFLPGQDMNPVAELRVDVGSSFQTDLTRAFDREKWYIWGFGIFVLLLLAAGLFLLASLPLTQIFRSMQNQHPGQIDPFSGKSTIGRIAGLIRSFYRQQAQLVAEVAQRRLMQEALQSSEQRHRIASEQTGQVVYDWDVKSGAIAWAGAIEEITGYGAEEFQRTNITLWEQMIHPQDRADAMELLDAAAKSDGKYSVEYRLRKRDGSYAYVEDNGVFLKNNQGVACRMVGTMKDVSERRQAGEARRLNESRQAAQIKLNQMMDKSEVEIIHFAMEEAVRLTESEIGYIAFLNEDETELTMQTWSDCAMRECRIQDKPIVHSAGSTGLWGEAVRQRRAIITNAYSADTPLKKGTPEGHVPIKRHLNAPVFDGHHIAIVAGVGNKPHDYDESDVRQLTLLMSGLWSIIQRKRAESKLAASEHLYRAIFETANDAIFLMTGETFIDCNSKTLDIFGCRRDQIIGQPPYRFSPKKQPDGRPSSDKAVEKIGAALAGTPQCFEWLHSQYDGTPFEAEVSLNRFEIAGTLMILAVVRDITERKKAERELERTRELLHAAVAQSPTGIIIASAPDGKIEYANLNAFDVPGATDPLQKRTLVADLTRDIPIFHTDGVTPFSREQLPLSRALREGVISRNIEIIFRHKPGEDRWVSINASPIRDHDGSVIAGVAIINEITDVKRADHEQRELKDKLQRAQRMESLGILAGGVAHDLNNMLGPVVGYSELLMRQLESEPKLAARAGKIMKSAQDAAEIIQDLLTLARRGRYEMSPLNLNDVIRSFVDSPACMSVRERHPNVSMEIDLTDDLTCIRGSDPHLAKVIMNLVSNASEAMTHGGTLLIRTELRTIRELLGGYTTIEPGDYVLLRVKDSGIGIAPEDMTKIFEPYYSKKKMGQSGTGLGLSIIYGVVKDHGGYYDVFSRIGHGTEFILYFPVCTDLSDDPRQSHPVSGGSERILVVDDAPEQRDLASEILSGLGYQVATADSGRRAVQYLAAQPVDLILLDMIMEADFDGLDAAREIFNLYPHQKIIVVSGFSATDRVQQMHKLGVGPYLRKPYTVDNLARIVRTVLNQKSPTSESQPILLS